MSEQDDHISDASAIHEDADVVGADSEDSHGSEDVEPKDDAPSSSSSSSSGEAADNDDLGGANDAPTPTDPIDGDDDGDDDDGDDVASAGSDDVDSKDDVSTAPPASSASLRKRNVTIESTSSSTPPPKKKSLGSVDVPPWLSEEISRSIPNRVLLIFLITWAPIILMACGSFVGALIALVIQNFHYILGIAAAVYVWGAAMGSEQNTKSSSVTILLIAAVVPIFVMEEPNALMRLITLVAFSGTPFLLEKYFPAGSEKDEDGKPTSDSELLALEHGLLYAAGPGIIFSLGAGCDGICDVVLLGSLYAASVMAAKSAIDPLVSAIPGAYKAHVESHKSLVAGVLQLKLANVLLLLLEWLVLPEGLTAHHNGFLWLMVLNILGTTVLAGGCLINSQEVISKLKLDAAMAKLVQTAFLGVVGGSYAILLMRHVLYRAFV